MKKTLSFVLVIAMLLTAMLGLTAYAAEEIDEIPELTITSARLEFGDRVYLLVAVKADSAEGLTLTITNPENTEKPVTVITEPIVDGDVPEGCIAFRYEDLGAKNMGDELTLQASVGETKGAEKTYSVLEYALRAENEGDATLIAATKAMITYGARAQKVFGHLDDATYPLQDSKGELIDYSLIRLLGGATFEGGSSKAIMKSGDASKTVANTKGTTAVWYNQAMQRLVNDADKGIQVEYKSGNQSVFAVADGVAYDQAGELDMDTYTGGLHVYKHVPSFTGYQKAPAGLNEGTSFCTNCTGGFLNKCSNCNGNGYTKSGSTKVSCDPCKGVGYVNSCGACGGKGVLGTVASTLKNGTKISVNGISSSAGTTAMPYHKIVVNNGYFAFTYGYTFSHDKFAAETKKVITNVTGADGGKIFTISATVAADGSAKDPLNYISLRFGSGTSNILPKDAQSATNSGGRYHILRGAEGGIFSTGYTVSGTATSDNVHVATSDITGVAANNPGQFITIHIVFDLTETANCPNCGGDGKTGSENTTNCTSCGGDGKASVMKYYLNDSTVPVQTVISANAAWFAQNATNNFRLDVAGQDNAGGVYIKALVTTAGDITTYFK